MELRVPVFAPPACLSSASQRHYLFRATRWALYSLPSYFRRYWDWRLATPALDCGRRLRVQGACSYCLGGVVFRMVRRATDDCLCLRPSRSPIQFRRFPQFFESYGDKGGTDALTCHEGSEDTWNECPHPIGEIPKESRDKQIKPGCMCVLLICMMELLRCMAIEQSLVCELIMKRHAALHCHVLASLLCCSSSLSSPRLRITH